MPLNSLSVGRDITVRLITDIGTLVLERLKEFEAHQETTELTSGRIDGNYETAFQPKRWMGSFTMDRRTPTIDAYFAQLEADFYNGVQRKAATLIATIAEASGSVTRWQFTHVALRYPEAGSWAGEKYVNQKVDFAASKRVQTA